ncbi:hypothetical protein [Sporolactobacillus spathodeae]|uniref:Uncharacterized protein n=1 Tax=Sporolactobacillus spathodeae TaxID=1465502 RepID=A0ABS2Q705_9BACL|nr:hypothetical protein [Sporolactobacillus spathodeae]MBM7657577.1 hypothetical protein [Sporolactobacillus spathodeae]
MKFFFRCLDLFNAACLVVLLLLAQLHQLHLSNNLQLIILSAVIASVMSAYMQKKGGRTFSAAAYFFATFPLLYLSLYTNLNAPAPFRTLIVVAVIAATVAGALKLSTYLISLGFFIYLLLLNYFPITHLDRIRGLADWIFSLDYQLHHGLINSWLAVIYMFGFFPAAFLTVGAVFASKDTRPTSYRSNRTSTHASAHSSNRHNWEEPDSNYYAYTEQSNNSSYFSSNNKTDGAAYSTSQTQHEEINHYGYKSWQADYDNDRQYAGYPTWARDKEIYERDYGNPWYARDDLEEDRQREAEEERRREEEEERRREEEEEEERRREEEEEERRRAEEEEERRREEEEEERRRADDDNYYSRW